MHTPKDVNTLAAAVEEAVARRLGDAISQLGGAGHDFTLPSCTSAA